MVLRLSSLLIQRTIANTATAFIRKLIMVLTNFPLLRVSALLAQYLGHAFGRMRIRCYLYIILVKGG